jgi:hypothetical protein
MIKRWLRKVFLVQPQNVTRVCVSIIIAVLVLAAWALVYGYRRAANSAESGCG